MVFLSISDSGPLVAHRFGDRSAFKSFPSLLHWPIHGTGCPGRIKVSFITKWPLRGSMANVIGPSGLSGCFRCFFVWRPRTPDPTRCPRCKSTLWDVPRLHKIRRGSGLGVREVIEPLRSQILAAIRANRASNPRVFGSVARGTASRRSDVDLLVDFDEGASVLDQIGLIRDLELVLRRKVDVTSDRGLHWIIRPQVLLEAVPL